MFAFPTSTLCSSWTFVELKLELAFVLLSGLPTYCMVVPKGELESIGGFQHCKPRDDPLILTFSNNVVNQQGLCIHRIAKEFREADDIMVVF